MNCQHQNVVFIPLSATSMDTAEAQWCMDCGQLKAHNSFAFMNPGAPEYLLFHPADSLNNEPQTVNGMTPPIGREYNFSKSEPEPEEDTNES